MSWYSRRVCGRIVLALCLYPGVVRAAGTDLLPRQIRELEARGELTQARDFLTTPERLKTLAPPIDPEDVKQHLALIESTLKLFEAATAYEEHALRQEAIGALKESLEQVSAPRDAGLAAAVNRRISQLQIAHTESQVSLAAEQAAREALTRADTLFARGLYKDAREAYEKVQKLTDPISSKSRARAVKGVAKASHAQFTDEPFGVIPTLIRSIHTAGTTIGGWLATLVLLLPAVALVPIVRRFSLTKTSSLELVDSTVLPSPLANRELAQQLEDVLEQIQEVSRGTTAKLEAGAATGLSDADDDDLLTPEQAFVTGFTDANDNQLPPPELVFVTPAAQAPEIASGLDKFVAAAPTVLVGPIGFNPQQLWLALRLLFVRRSRLAFVGSLVTYDGSLILRMTKEDRLHRTKLEWRAPAPSSSKTARTTCLVDVACQIILDAQKEQTKLRVTSNHESLKAYVLGMDARSGPETPESLKTAAGYFQQALDRDANNWLARFELALTLRALKDTRRAIGHLTFLASEDAAKIPSCGEHLKKHPDFIHVVKYHLASTLAVQDQNCTDDRVATLLDELVALETDTVGAALDSPGRLHLVMLARSAQSTRDSLRVSRMQDKDKAAAQKETGEARERVKAHLEWLTSHESDLQSASAAYDLARGLVLHAFGRLEFASGDQKNALKHLTEAVQLLPDYADVHVDLARVHLKSKKDPRWPLRVTQLLDRALALDTGNHKARFVYARFFFADETKDLDQAEIHLKTMPFDPVCLFMRAQIHSSRGQHAETLDVLERAIALQRKGPLFRVRLYAESLLALAKDDKARRIAEPARNKLCGYDRLFEGDERKSKNYLRIRQIYEEVCMLLKVAADDAKCFQAGATVPSTAAPPVVPQVPGSIDPRTIADGDLQGT